MNQPKLCANAFIPTPQIDANELLDYAKECEGQIIQIQAKIVELQLLARQARREYATIVGLDNAIL